MNRIGLVLAICVLLSAHLGYTGEAPGRGPTEDIAYLRSAPVAPGQQPYSQRQTDGNAMGLVVSNFGVFGNNLVRRAPSMEYPLGSEIDHLVRAGLWLGGINADGDTVVSTGCTAGYTGTSSAATAEFTPGTDIVERSTIVTSDVYSEKAVSVQDFLTEYTDYPRRGTNETILRARVRQASYLWSHQDAEAFVVMDFTILNESEGTLDKVYLGIFAELCSGWKGAYDFWPPPSSSWFKNKVLEYFDRERLCAEHHYTYQDGDAPSWGGIALLGAYGAGVDSIGQLTMSFNWWDWYWERDHPMDDTDRYNVMKNGEIDSTDGITPRADDPVELISVGPFDHIAPGDSITLVCAFVGGMDRQSLIDNTWWAQNAFDNNYVFPSVTVISPNGGEIWETGTPCDIQWLAMDDVAVASVSIILSTDGGVTFPDTLATGEENDGRFTWHVAGRLTNTARIKVIAYDGDGNTAEDTSDGDFQIRRPMELSLGVLQNPYLTRYLDLYLIGSRSLDPGSVELSVGGQPISVHQVDSEHDVWMGDYKLPDGTAVISLKGCASDTAGNDTCVTADFSSSYLHARDGGRISSPDGKISVRVGPGALASDIHLIVVQCKGCGDEAGSGAAADQVGSLRLLAPDHVAPFCYYVGPRGALGNRAAYLEFHYTDSDLRADGTPDQLYIEQDGVRALPSYIDLEKRTIGAEISEFGEFRLASGPAATSKVTDPRYVRLYPGRPNPFSASTAVRFEIRDRQHVTAAVHDVAGRVVACLLDEPVYPGVHQVTWDGLAFYGHPAASGLYFIRVATEHGVSSSKIVKLR